MSIVICSDCLIEVPPGCPPIDSCPWCGGLLEIDPSKRHCDKCDKLYIITDSHALFDKDYCSMECEYANEIAELEESYMNALKGLGKEIMCAKCGKIISDDYNRDRGHAEAELYTHVCTKEKGAAEAAPVN